MVTECDTRETGLGYSYSVHVWGKGLPLRSCTSPYISGIFFWCLQLVLLISMVQCNPSFPKKLIVLFASNGYTPVLYDLEERQTILMAETTTKNVPCLFLPSTCQGTGPVTACDCMESNESAAYLITQGMGDIMRWNKTAFILHSSVKPEFWPVQASKTRMTLEINGGFKTHWIK